MQVVVIKDECINPDDVGSIMWATRDYPDCLILEVEWGMVKLIVY